MYPPLVWNIGTCLCSFSMWSRKPCTCELVHYGCCRVGWKLHWCWANANETWRGSNQNLPSYLGPLEGHWSCSTKLTCDGQWGTRKSVTSHTWEWLHNWDDTTWHSLKKHSKEDNTNYQESPFRHIGQTKWRFSDIPKGPSTATSHIYSESSPTTQCSTKSISLCLSSWVIWLQLNAIHTIGIHSTISHETKEKSFVGWVFNGQLVIRTSPKYYRCYKIFVKDTRQTCISDILYFKHKYITQPTVTPADAINKAWQHLAVNGKPITEEQRIYKHSHKVLTYSHPNFSCQAKTTLGQPQGYSSILHHWKQQYTHKIQGCQSLDSKSLL